MNIAAPKNPTVTIGLPVFNGEDYLEGTIESLLSQTFEDFELIISDNASTDATQAICERFAAEDPRVRYDRLPENVGAAPNYNRLVPMARGKYFKWAAHDDRCMPAFLERCVAVLERDPSVVLAYPTTSVIDADGAEMRIYRDGLGLGAAKPADRLARYLDVNFLGVRGMCNPIFGLIRTDELRRTRLIQDFVASDRSLLGHLALLGRFVEMEETLFERRIHLNTSTMAYAGLNDRKKWFNPKAKTGKSSRDNHLALRATHVFDFWRAIDELVPDAATRRSCHLAMLKMLTIRPRWFWRDVKYSLGYQPGPLQILQALRQDPAR